MAATSADGARDRDTGGGRREPSAAARRVAKSLGLAVLAAPLWLPLVLICVALIAQAVMAVAPIAPEAEPALHAVVMVAVMVMLVASWGRGVVYRALNPDSVATGPLGRHHGSTLFTATPLTGYRQWVVVPGERLGDGMPIPYLASPVFPTLWDGPSLDATCASAVGRHLPDDVPALECTCGIYARKAQASPATDRVTATGSVALSGLVLEGSEGFRASRARINGPLSIALGQSGSSKVFGWSVPRRHSDPPGEIWLIGDRLVPVAPSHPPPGEPDGRWPIEEFSRHLRTWLEARYGVTVTMKGAP